MAFASSLNSLTNSSGVSAGISLTPAFAGGKSKPFIEVKLSDCTASITFKG